MKNSGIEWIGEIPDSWEVNLVKNIFDITRGRVIAKTEIEDEPLEDYYPVYSSQTANSGILGYIPSYDFAVDSLTWTTDGAKAGTVFLRRGKYSITNVCGILTLKSKKYSLDYLNYAVGFSAYNCRRADINGYKIMSSEMAIIPIVVPYLEEQQRIAKHLDEKCGKIDELIANQQGQIEKLKEYKQSVITEAVTKGLDKSAPLKDSGIEWIGEIPAHWQSIRLKYCTYIRARLGWKGLKAEEYVDEGYPLLSAFNIINDKLDASDVNFINQFRYDESPEIKLSINDILLVKDGAGIGKCAIVEELIYPSTTNGSLAVITTNNGLLAKYLYYYFLSKMFQKYIDRLKAGMGVPHLFQSDLREIEIPFSTIEEQEKIVSYLDEKCGKIDRLIAIKQEKIEKLQEYKKSLIYEYVTGKKEVV